MKLIHLDLVMGAGRRQHDITFARVSDLFVISHWEISRSSNSKKESRRDVVFSADEAMIGYNLVVNFVGAHRVVQTSISNP